MTASTASKTPARSASGFTLIELLTVIAIIGILAAIIIPVVGKVRSTAKVSQSVANLRSIGQAVLFYTDEHKQTLPALLSGGGHFWTDDLVPYLGPKVESPHVDRHGANLKISPALISPVLSDGYHNEISDYGASNELFRDPAKGQALRRMNQIKNPTRLVAVAAAESRTHMASKGTTDPSGSYFIQAFDYVNNPDSTSIQGPSTHGAGRVPAVFLDGHVEQFTRAEMAENRVQLFRLNP